MQADTSALMSAKVASKKGKRRKHTETNGSSAQVTAEVSSKKGKRRVLKKKKKS